MSVIDDVPVGEVAEVNVELSRSVVDEDKEWDWEKIMTADEAEKTGLRGQIRELPDQCPNVHVEAVEAVALAKQSLDLERPFLDIDCLLGKK